MGFHLSTRLRQAIKTMGDNPRLRLWWWCEGGYPFLVDPEVYGSGWREYGYQMHTRLGIRTGKALLRNELVVGTIDHEGGMFPDPGRLTPKGLGFYQRMRK